MRAPLSTDENKIGDAGAASLAAALKDSRLDCLMLSKSISRIRYKPDAPIVLYTNSVPRTSPYLYLSDENQVSDAGASALAAALKDSSLSVLALSTLSAAAILGAFH